MSNPTTYTIRPGDTLGRISKFTGKPVSELVEVNHLANPDRLEIGQVLYLDKKEAHSVQVMLMDVLRYPIEGVKTLLKFDGKLVELDSNASGLLPKISTQSIHSKVEVFVQDSRSEWTKIAETVSGLGEQWIKLISPAIKYKETLMRHDDAVTKTPLKRANTKANPGKGEATGTPIKKGHPVKKKVSKNRNTIELDVEIPQDLMAYFKLYKDEPISEDDWLDAADRLGCEKAVLQAISKVESGGASAFWKLNSDGDLHVPKILFERHYFHRLTCSAPKHGVGVKGCQGPHDEDPDISWPVGYRKRKLEGSADAKMSSGVVRASDVYSSSASAYLRLLKAYRKDPGAALKSASWGKFQVMGSNYIACGEDNVIGFVQKMCAGEKGQLSLLAGFIQKNPALHTAVKTKDWAGIARNYNGPGYKTFSYDTKLEHAYNEFKKKGGA